MKKFFSFTFVILLFISCSESENASIDPIIGKWKLKHVYFNGVDGLTHCDRQTTMEFLPDGRLLTEIYRQNSDKECITTKGDLLWEKDKTDNGWYCYGGSCSKYIFKDNNNVMINPGNPGHKNPEDWDTIYIRIE